MAIENCMAGRHIKSKIRLILTHPLLRGLAADDPRVATVWRQMVYKKPFLRRLYQEWYEIIAAALPGGSGKVLEIGSGSSFIKSCIPEAITSEILNSAKVDIILDGHKLPFKEGALRCLILVDVLHHLNKPASFFTEVTRCVRCGGAVVMIEPWVTTWSRLIWEKLHHEPFLPTSAQWEYSLADPLLGANTALPWILFDRDRLRFESYFPQWQIKTIQPMMPFRYLFSGGVSYRNLMPAWSYSFWKKLEDKLEFSMKRIGMFAKIVLVKKEK